MLNRNAILQNVDRAKTVDRNAACADVARGFTARGFNPKAGHRLHGFGDRCRGLHSQAVFIDGGDGVAGVDLGADAATGTAGHDHSFWILGVRFAGGRCGHCLRHGDAHQAHSDDSALQKRLHGHAQRAGFEGVE